MRSFTSKSEAETKSIAQSIAQSVLERPLGKKALVIPLIGDLGAGKTTFVKGFLSGFGIKTKVLSPTFVIMKRYLIKNRGLSEHIYHFDCYRIKNPHELEAIGIKEIIANPKNIILIEWPENAGPYSIGKSISFSYGDSENIRKIKTTL